MALPDETVTRLPWESDGADSLIRPLPAMRAILSFLALPVLAVSMANAAESEVSSTEKLKDSIREWIETTREIQKQEDDWDQDSEVLQGHRDGLQTEIEDLKEQIEKAKASRGAADKKSLEVVEKYDALKSANDLLSSRLAELEKAMVERLPIFPPALTKEPRVAQMISDLRASAAKSDQGEQGGNARLNNVLNLMAAAEQFQGSVHSDSESRKVADGRELKINMVYFGLAAAYGVDDAGQVAFVGKPGPDGWVFEEKNELAAQVRQLVDVMNGDADAKFISLPISLP
jgi:membrane-associated HD superfamily phosphohydrolase